MLIPYVAHPDYLISVAPSKPSDPASGKWLLHVNPREKRDISRDGGTVESKLYLRYAIVSEFREAGPVPYRYFDASYNGFRNSVSLVASVLFLDPEYLRGHGIGVCLMNRIIDWAREWPEATVSPIDIFDPDAKIVARRKNFYGKFGLEFDDVDGIPVMKQILVKDVKKAEPGSMNTIIDLSDGLMLLCKAKEQLKDGLREKTAAYDKLNENYNLFITKPLRTGISNWISLNLFWLVMSGLIAIIAALIWLSMT